MTESRVFLTQRPSFRDPVSGEWRDKYDLRPAERFGRLVAVLPVGNIPRDVGQSVRMMEDALRDFGPSDHVLAMGDPVAIALCMLVLARRTGGRPISMLKWDRVAGEYAAHLVSTGP